MDSYWKWNKENFDWHFDPASREVDVQYVGRFVKEDLADVVANTASQFTTDDAYDEVSIKGTPYNKEAAEIMEGYHNDLTRAGFTSHNTGGNQRRNDLPEEFHKMAELSGLKDPQIMFLEQPPGRSIPWHRDSYNNYRRNFAKVSDDTEVINTLTPIGSERCNLQKVGFPYEKANPFGIQELTITTTSNTTAINANNWGIHITYYFYIN